MSALRLARTITDIREQRAVSLLRTLADAIERGHPYDMPTRVMTVLHWLEAAFPGCVPSLVDQIHGYDGRIAHCCSEREANTLASEIEQIATAAWQAADAARRKADELIGQE